MNGEWPTTRRHPRTTLEAFRRADYAASVERSRERQHRIVDKILLVILAIFVGMLFSGALDMVQR